MLTAYKINHKWKEMAFSRTASGSRALFYLPLTSCNNIDVRNWITGRRHRRTAKYSSRDLCFEIIAGKQSLTGGGSRTGWLSCAVERHVWTEGKQTESSPELICKFKPRGEARRAAKQICLTSWGGRSWINTIDAARSSLFKCRHKCEKL